MVGIGASAVGLAAFEAFLAAMPQQETGMAFVLVQHLSPDHKSVLVDLIKRHTRMEVFEAGDAFYLPPGGGADVTVMWRAPRAAPPCSAPSPWSSGSRAPRP